MTVMCLLYFPPSIWHVFLLFFDILSTDYIYNSILDKSVRLFLCVIGMIPRAWSVEEDLALLIGGRLPQPVAAAVGFRLSQKTVLCPRWTPSSLKRGVNCLSPIFVICFAIPHPDRTQLIIFTPKIKCYPQGSKCNCCFWLQYVPPLICSSLDRSWHRDLAGHFFWVF